MSLIREHDFEPLPGLPGPLPEGEFLCWQGKPDWRDMAISAMHVRKLALYFAALLILRFSLLLNQGVPTGEILFTTAVLSGLAALALGLLTLLAWLMARATVYTMTNRRIVIRSGVALPMTVNLPYATIVSADLKQRRKGFGDIPLTLESESQASWIMLWPNVRPWHFGKAQPMLRALADSESVAGRLKSAFQDYQGGDADPAGEFPLRRNRSWQAPSELHGAH